MGEFSGGEHEATFSGGGAEVTPLEDLRREREALGAELDELTARAESDEDLAETEQDLLERIDALDEQISEAEANRN